MRSLRAEPQSSATRFVKLGTVLAVGLTAAWLVVPVSGDVFNLKNGGKIEGQLKAEDPNGYTVRTFAGEMHLGRDAVASIERKRSVFDDYDERLAKLSQTAPDHMALADWCAAHGLKIERLKHLREALALDPDYAPARAALGFARVADYWIDTHAATRDAAARERQAQRAAQREQAERQARYARTLRTVIRNKLASADAAVRQEGLDALAALTDPLVLAPLFDALTAEKRAGVRAAYIDHLATFAEPEAVQALTITAVEDPADELRALAIDHLKKKNDPNAVTVLRGALVHGRDWMIRHAAVVLGELRARVAIPDLIAVLQTNERRAVELLPREVQRVYPGYAGRGVVQWNDETGVPLAGPVRVRECFPDSWSWLYVAPTRPLFEERSVPVCHTEVREALQAITGQDFGFVQAEWRRWYDSQH